MSGRRRPPAHNSYFRRAPLDSATTHLFDEIRSEGPPGRGRHLPPHHLGAMEDHLNFQTEEIQHLLVDNQRLAATHVALKQDVASTEQEIQRATHASHVYKSHRLREGFERSMRLETELHQMNAMKNEVEQIRGDIQKMYAERQEMSLECQGLSQFLSRAAGDVHQVPAVREEIEAFKEKIQHTRVYIEHEKTGYADSYESRQQMQNNLISMTREAEKLRNEIANVEKRATTTTSAGGQTTGYGGNCKNPGPDPSYGGNHYPAGYGMAPIPGNAVASAQYGAESGAGPASGSGHALASWGVYEM